ncbi:MAG: NADH-quinone oxidoreductase subunit C, partial [Alphaproteobacteria bacterium]|nr:NADH-quinone oxidoreductase subunit C [Alphaproteobacteria bacterium]
MALGRPSEQEGNAQRVVFDEACWNAMAEDLAAGRYGLAGLWGEVGAVHAALVDANAGSLALASYECLRGRFPALSRVHPPAIRLERAIHDLFGLMPEGAPDLRPWLDHGRWPYTHPLAAAGSGPPETTYAFLPVEGEGVHQI